MNNTADRLNRLVDKYADDMPGEIILAMADAADELNILHQFMTRVTGLHQQMSSTMNICRQVLDTQAEMFVKVEPKFSRSSDCV